MEVMSVITTENTNTYVYNVDGRSLRLDKAMADKYSEIVCPITEEYISYLIKVFGQDNCKDNVLSCKIALDMANELNGYER